MHDVTSNFTPTDGHEQTPLRTYFTRILPLFAAMLALTGLTSVWLLQQGYAPALSEASFLVSVTTLAVAIGMIVGASHFRETWPLNIVFAAGLAVAEGVLLAPFAQEVVAAGLVAQLAESLIFAAGIFVAFSAVQLLTGWDFSFLGGALLVALFVILGLVIVDAFVGFTGLTHAALYGGSVVVFSLFILYDMSKIQEGEYGPVMGAISLYLDFLLIFLYLFELLHGDP